jgi:hypothetical protein
MTSFSMPHWSDPVICAVAEAIYDDAWSGSTRQFQRGDAVKFWPGIESRKFVAMMRAYAEATTASADARAALADEPKHQAKGEGA